MSGSWIVSGSVQNTLSYLRRLLNKEAYAGLDSLAQEACAALEANTPKDSGVTAGSWSYEIQDQGGLFRIIWSNSSMNKGVNIAVILQYGHGTGTGGYVAGQDYINPAMQPVFDKISDTVWKAVTS